METKWNIKFSRLRYFWNQNVKPSIILILFLPDFLDFLVSTFTSALFVLKVLIQLTQEKRTKAEGPGFSYRTGDASQVTRHKKHLCSFFKTGSPPVNSNGTEPLFLLKLKPNLPEEPQHSTAWKTSRRDPPIPGTQRVKGDPTPTQALGGWIRTFLSLKIPF